MKELLAELQKAVAYLSQHPKDFDMEVYKNIQRDLMTDELSEILGLLVQSGSIRIFEEATEGMHLYQIDVVARAEGIIALVKGGHINHIKGLDVAKMISKSD